MADEAAARVEGVTAEAEAAAVPVAAASAVDAASASISAAGETPGLALSTVRPGFSITGWSVSIEGGLCTELVGAWPLETVSSVSALTPASVSNVLMSALSDLSVSKRATGDVTDAAGVDG
jgi:hypothetical protein